MSEVWRPVGEFPAFEVSSLGRVRRTGGKLKKLTIRKADGYPCVGFWDGSHTNARLVHQLVCEAFHGPRPSPLHDAAHWDGSRSNNRADNLRWATKRENAGDRYRHGTHLQGDDCPWAFLTAGAVTEIRAAPKRAGECAKLAARFGISENYVASLRTPSKGLWPDVPFPARRHA